MGEKRERRMGVCIYERESLGDGRGERESREWGRESRQWKRERERERDRGDGSVCDKCRE